MCVLYDDNMFLDGTSNIIIAHQVKMILNGRIVDKWMTPYPGIIFFATSQTYPVEREKKIDILYNYMDQYKNNYMES